MSDEILESNSSDGSGGSPDQPVSSGENVQPTSSFNPDDLLKLLEPLIDKKVQSVKDRRIAELENTVKGIQPVLERFKGLVPDEKLREIQKDLEFEDLKRKVYGTEIPTSEPEIGTQKANAAINVEPVIAEFGLDMTDPEVRQAFAGKQFTSNVEVKAVIADLMKPKPQPTSAQTPSTPAPSTRIGNTDELLREFNQLAVHPTRNEKRLGEIEKTLKAAGVW